MKVALCLSGQIREWKTSYSDIYTKIIKKYNCDVFIHSWNVIGRHIQHHIKKDFNDGLEKQNYEFLLHYNPIKSKTDYSDYNFFREKSKSDDRFYNVLMMWYSIYQSNELKKEYERERGFKYDCVIRARFDLEVQNFEIPSVEKNTIYLSPSLMGTPLEQTQQQKEWNLYLKEKGLKEYPNDVLAYGDSPSMDYFASLYDRIDKNPKYEKNPHEALRKHLYKEDNIFDVQENDKILLNIIR